MSRLSFPYDYSATGRRRIPVTSQRTSGSATYLDEQPIYGDTSQQMLPGTAVARSPQATQAPQAPAAPYFALQNARSDRQRQQTIMGNAVQARSNANYAAAAPLPATPPLPTPAGSTVAPLPSRSASAAPAAPGRIQMTEQAAREMLRNLGATRPGMTLEQLRPEFTQTLGKYGVDGNALWSQWQQAGTLGKSDYVNGQTTSPAQPQIIAPANQQAGTGGIAMLPGGQTVVTNANGRQVGGPIAQGAPLPSTTTPTYGAEPGYTPLPTGGNYAQAAPAAQPAQTAIPTTQPSPAPTTQPTRPSYPGMMAGTLTEPIGMFAAGDAPQTTAATPPTQPQRPAPAALPTGGAPAPAPPTQTYSGALPGVDPQAAAARQAYIGRQNDRADILSGGYYTNRDNATNLVDAQADSLRSGAADARGLQSQANHLQTQNTQLQNQVTRMQNSQTLAGARGQTLAEQKQKAYYESRIDSAREDLHTATAAYSANPNPANHGALQEAQKALRNTHLDYQTHLEGGAPSTAGAPVSSPPTTRPTAAPGQPNSYSDPNLPRPGASQQPRQPSGPGGTPMKLPSGDVIYKQSDGSFLDAGGGAVVIR